MARICLIGEADPFIARLLQRFAAECGLQALRADDGEGLIELARLHVPTVIILEPELPGTVRGWEAAQALSEDPILCHIPVIACTWVIPGTPVEATSAGLLHKPELHYDDFVAALTAAGVPIKTPPPNGR
jgi:CheY-like chemotaxis protein